MRAAPFCGNRSKAPNFRRPSNVTEITGTALMLSFSALSIDQALLIGRAVFLVFCFGLAAVAFTRWRKASDRTTELFFEQNSALLKRLSTIEEQLATTQAQLTEARSEIATIATRTEGVAERLE